MLKALFSFAKSIPDYRRTDRGHVIYKLSDLVLLCIIARLAKSANTRAEIIEFADHNLSAFNRLGLLRKRLPSEATLCRMEQNIDDNQLSYYASLFAEKFSIEQDDNKLKIIAIDGQFARGTTQANGRNPDIISAYSADQKMTLKTEVCDEKSNEITAAPKLLEGLNIENCVITADAMLCQKSFVDAVRNRDGNFVVQVKANQKGLRWSLEDKIKKINPLDKYSTPYELSHGRIMQRTCQTFDGAKLIDDPEKWGHDLTIICVKVVNIEKSTGKTSEDNRIYISNLQLSAKDFNDVIRKHWAIESMHWSLDTTMRHDATKRKKVRAAHNTDTMMRLCLSIMSIWRSQRKKKSDRKIGYTDILRRTMGRFTAVMNLLQMKMIK